MPWILTSFLTPLGRSSGLRTGTNPAVGAAAAAASLADCAVMKERLRRGVAVVGGPVNLWAASELNGRKWVRKMGIHEMENVMPGKCGCILTFC